MSNHPTPASCARRRIERIPFVEGALVGDLPTPQQGAEPMKTILVVSAAIVIGFSGCGLGTCERVDRANKRFFGNRSECSYLTGSQTVTVRPGQSTVSACNTAFTRCSTVDQQVLEGYTKCLETAPFCAPGNEKPAADGYTACSRQLFTVSGTTVTSKLSTDCAAGLQ
jgi:hypothetical protein